MFSWFLIFSVLQNDVNKVENLLVLTIPKRISVNPRNLEKVVQIVCLGKVIFLKRLVKYAPAILIQYIDYLGFCYDMCQRDEKSTEGNY